MLLSCMLVLKVFPFFPSSAYFLNPYLANFEENVVRLPDLVMCVCILYPLGETILAFPSMGEVSAALQF